MKVEPPVRRPRSRTTERRGAQAGAGDAGLLVRLGGQEGAGAEGRDQERLLGAGSPDIADALALTFAAPVQRRHAIDIYDIGRRPTARQEYDPYANLERGYDPYSYGRNARNDYDPFADIR